MSDYLWDRSEPVDPDVEAIETPLRSLAFDPTARPLTLPPARRAWRPLFVAAATLAAAVALLVGAMAFHTWRLNWQPERSWAVNGGQSLLAVGSPLTVTAAPSTIDIARLGTMQAAPGTTIDLLETGQTHHRLNLSRGAIDVRLWAPPGRVVVRTPAGDVIDLGCIFSLSVDEAGAAHLRVRTGWVNLQNARGNSFIPAGASSSMTADHEPLVPVYDDGAVAFRTAVRAMEADAAHVDRNALQTIVALARDRDVITLLTLSDVAGLDTGTRRALLTAAARHRAAPTPDAVERIVNGDRDLFWQWYDSLPLPSLKNWWANWRDVIPR